MSYQGIEPDLFLEHHGVAVYHCYDDEGNLSWYRYTTNPTANQDKWPLPETGQFDVRDLPSAGLDATNRHNHEPIIRHAIEAGLISGQPAVTAPPLRVKIEVQGGVATVIEQPPGVEVEIIDQDVAEVETAADPLTDQGTASSLMRFADRLAYLIVDLNGLIISIVNDEVTGAEFAAKLPQLVDQLSQVENAVRELTDRFWGNLYGEEES